MLDAFDRLKDETDPSAEGSEVDKDRKAFEALQHAGTLVNFVAGWAVDHTCGLAIDGLEFLPLTPRSNPHYAAAKEAVDHHKHEAALSNTAAVDPTVVRRMATNLLLANPGGFPPVVQSMLLAGLHALEFGEVQPILAPNRAAKKVFYFEMMCQLEAVAFVEYLSKSGLRKYSAQDKIADTYGISAETLRSWEKRLRESLGTLKVARAIMFAQIAGRNISYMRSHSLEDAEHMLERIKLTYGEEAMSAAARRYRETVRNAKQRSGAKRGHQRTKIEGQ